MYFSFHGFLVGLGLSTFGLLLDNTISYPSKMTLLQRDSGLVKMGYFYTTFNLLVLNPVYYDVISKHLITNHSHGLDFFKYIRSDWF